MPTKIWQYHGLQQDQHRQQVARDPDQPRSFDASAKVDDANADTSPRTDPDDDINTHGSER